MANFDYFKRKDQEGTPLTPEPIELGLLEQIQTTAAALDRYLQASPTNPPCFLTRALIAGSDKGSAVFSMAEAIPIDPNAIKNNVNKAALPEANCLKKFTAAYWQDSNNVKEDFKNLITGLFQVTNCIYWFLEKQHPKDEELLDIIKNIRTNLNVAHGECVGVFPDSSEPTQALLLADVPGFLKPLAGFMRGGATQRQLEVLIEQYTTAFMRGDVNSLIPLSNKP